MNLPKDTKLLIWGAIGGAVLCIALGFTWGGWVTGATARKEGAIAQHNGMVAALAPICAERFRSQADGPAKLTDLAKANSWERSGMVERSGYALMPGSKTSNSDVARACAEMLANPAPPKT
jgi:hypothetical protein